MCLILFAYDAHPDYRLIMAANRDEFYDRPTEKAAWRSGILSGLDLLAGGTWLGITESGRFAALTNYRDPASHVHGKKTRGALASDFLRGDMSADIYLKSLSDSKDEYNGYNLLFGDGGDLHWFSNKTGGHIKLQSGIFGLSNHLLDTPWPKVQKGKRMLSQAIGGGFTQKELLDILSDEKRAADNELPETGVGLELERVLSPMFIKSPTYGTRSSTVLTIDRAGRASFTEKTYLYGIGNGETTEHFHIS